MWRSLLYVPANVPRYLGRAQSRGADALILDLEDSVPDTRKAEARRILAAHWDGLRAGPSDLIVRINGDMRRAVHDLEQVVRPGLAAIYLPKATSADFVVHVAELIAALEAENGVAHGTTRIVPMIETPAALEQVFAIAAAHPRVCGLTLGSEDFATACAMMPTPQNLLSARQRIVFAARAAGISPYGLLDSVANLSTGDLPDLVARSRDFGFDGASAVHPDTTPHLNRGFSQSEENRIWAKGVIDALDQAERDGKGAARYDGRMVDRPMRVRADMILKSR